MNAKRAAWTALAVIAFLAFGGPPAAAEEFVLENGRLKAEFDDQGLIALSDVRTGRRIAFMGDPTAVKVDGRALSPEALGPAEVETKPARLSFRYAKDPWTLDVFYELRPGWPVLSKQIVLTSARTASFHVEEVRAFSSTVGLPVLDELRLSKGDFGALLRFGSGEGGAPPPAWSLFFMLQNPFMSWAFEGQRASVSYAPDMDWRPEDGPFVSDRLLVGLVELGGTKFPAQAIPEWKLVPDYGKYLAGNPVIDAEEALALTESVRAFLLVSPARSVRVHVPWCENDYQIDVGTPEGVAEYKRILDRAAELGAGHLLYTPANRELSRLEDNADAWGWENLLWFALGQKIRKGEWDPRVDAVPPGLREMIDYASSRNLKLMAYAYPSLPFLQRLEWTAWAGPEVGGYSGADTGQRSFQDWWIETLTAFMRTTGASGFSFDHWWIAYDKASSKYAQWAGCRRVLETLRRRASDVVIDGRQQYQNFGPWTWLAGSYPHPSLTDEQPESFTAFPDLHTDRVSADRQRFAAWKYSVERFAPPEIMPGFITHQSERSDEKGVMRRDRFRPKDWDCLGWKYSLLSSIATAPFNHVINFIPARDPEEFKAFSGEDLAFFKKWLDWTDQNVQYLRRLRPIIGQPAIGRADGTAAVVDDSGFIFLFNPNPGRVEARFKLDASVGLRKGEAFVLRELYPVEGRFIGSARGFWAFGEEVVLPLPGREAVVLDVFPAPAEIPEPALFNALGDVSLSAGRLALSGVSGEPGAARDLVVLLPKGKKARTVSVNGVPHPFKAEQDTVMVNVRFAGRAFGRSQSAGEVPASFEGGVFEARFNIPARVFAQLTERKKSWPVSYTDDDLRATWVAPWRLLLHAVIAEPEDSMEVAMKINGKPVDVKKAYNSVYPHSPARTFVGHYADVSWLKPDVPYKVEVTLPQLPRGRFLGLFFENIEPESTQRIMAPRPAAPAAPAAKKVVPRGGGSTCVSESGQS